MAPIASSAIDVNQEDVLLKYNLNKESDRVKTFYDLNWKCKHVQVEELGRLGFYFFARPDKVKCIFCHVVLHDFEEGDNILEQHMKFAPNCPLLRRRKTSNVAIDFKELEKVLPAASYDECGSKSMRRNSKSVEHEAYPEYKSAVARLESFESKLWPIGITQKPRDLVEAGFFYSGQSDITICFSCGVALGKWEVTDNPWVEHKKNLKKKCLYLQSNNDMLEDNQRKHQNDLQASKAAVSTEEAPTVSEESACKICFSKKASVIFLPCRHVAVCNSCSLWIEEKCPICRTEIKDKFQLFYA